jgi:hypothetical protein
MPSGDSHCGIIAAEPDKRLNLSDQPLESGGFMHEW